MMHMPIMPRGKCGVLRYGTVGNAVATQMHIRSPMLGGDEVAETSGTCRLTLPDYAG